MGRHFFAKMISPEYVFSLLPTGFFIFLIQQQCENVCYLLIDYIVYMVNNQSNRAQGSGLLRRRSVVSFNSELEVKTKVNSAFSRPYISLKTTKVEKKVLPIRFRSLSQHEIESIYYVGQGL